MDKKRTKQKMTAFLPASACEQELYDRLTEEAKLRGVSRAALIREAVQKFLRKSSPKQGT